MKKALKTRIKKWKIGDYVRQFSIVVGGVLLTLWLTGKITDSAKQREVRQAMQLLTLELRDNLATVQNYERIYNDEKRIALQLQELKFDISGLSVDTVLLFRQRLYSGLGKPHQFSTDALEMLKTSGLTSHIADKQQALELLRCYTSLKSFDVMMDIYFGMRKEALVTYDKANPRTANPELEEDYMREFRHQTADPKIQSWLFTIPRGFDRRFFERCEEELRQMISKLETTYK